MALAVRSQTRTPGVIHPIQPRPGLPSGSGTARFAV